jgi:hypothetical protein
MSAGEHGRDEARRALDCDLPPPTAYPRPQLRLVVRKLLHRHVRLSCTDCSTLPERLRDGRSNERANSFSVEKATRGATVTPMNRAGAHGASETLYQVFHDVPFGVVDEAQ